MAQVTILRNGNKTRTSLPNTDLERFVTRVLGATAFAGNLKSFEAALRLKDGEWEAVLNFEEKESIWRLNC